MKVSAKNFIQILMATLLLVGFVEASTRVLVSVQKDWNLVSQNDWKVLSPELGWRPRPGYSGWAAREYRTFDEQGYVEHEQISDEKKHFKILLLGDSCSYGLKVASDATFGALLESRLPGVEVMNRAVPGYSSFQGLEVLKESLDIKPDLILASFSFNDRRSVLNQEYQDSKALFSSYAQWPWLNKIRRLSSFIQWVSGQNAQRVDLRNVSVRVPFEQYRTNLEQIADLATANGVPLLFLVLQDNPNIMALTKRGEQLRKQGKLREASNVLHQAIVLKPLIAELPKLLMARTLEELGEHQKAHKIANVRARFAYDGGGPLRIDSQYAEAMIEVAQRKEVKVFDARALLQANPHVFYDVVHFDELGHKILAQGLFEYLTQHQIVQEIRGGEVLEQAGMRMDHS